MTNESTPQQPAQREPVKFVRVAAAVIEQEGLVRIFRRGGNDSYTGKWEFPGGKLEDDETPEEALRRELCEEFAVDSEIGPMLDHYWYKYPKREPISLTFFAAKLLGVPEFIEHTESAWVQPAQLTSYDLMNADMVFVATRYVQQAHIDRLSAENAALLKDKERLDWLDERTKCDNIWNAVHFYPKAMAFTAANDGAKGSFANVREAIDAELALTEQTAQPDKPASKEGADV